MLFQFKEENSWGMINEKGEIVVKPIYEKLSDIVEGYALGSVNYNWFYLDEKGNIVKEFNVDEMYLFNDGMAGINICGCKGYINKKFQVVIEPKYGARSYCFNEDLAAVRTPKKYGDELYGFINKKGEQVIDFKYEVGSWFSEGLAVVTLDNKVGAIDKNDRFIIDNKYDVLNDFKDGRAFFSKDNLWGIVDNQGNEIAYARFEEDEDYWDNYDYQNFSEGLAIVYENKKYGYIDREGKMASDIAYDSAVTFREGIASVRVGSTWFIIDKGINTIKGVNCESVTCFNNGLARICINGKWGFIDKKGNIVVEPKYEQVFDFHNGAAATMLNGKFGYIDNKGKEFFRADKGYNEPYCSFVLW